MQPLALMFVLCGLLISSTTAHEQPKQLAEFVCCRRRRSLCGDDGFDVPCLHLSDESMTMLFDEVVEDMPIGSLRLKR